MTLGVAASPGPRFWLGPIDPIRLETFRVAMAFSLLCYTLAWFQDAAEWLTPVGFHVSTAAAGAYAPVAPPLPVAALPIFAVVLFGSITAVIVGFKLAWTTPSVLLLVTYLSYVDPLSAFTLNRLYMASFAVLSCVPLGSYWSLGDRTPAPQSAWPIRILQATLLVQYCTAGWCKVAHGNWLSDSYVLWSQAQGWYRTDLASLALQHLPKEAWAVMQWGALLFELFAPLLFGVRRLRPVAFLLGGAFQGLTALLMHQLVYFSLQMLCFYVLFVDDATLHRLRAACLAWGRRTGEAKPA